MIRPTQLIGWVQERIDVQSAIAFVADNLRKPIPKHVNFLYTFGSIALFLFVAS